MELSAFIEQLSSKAPVPGGGGASALAGALGAALCSMVANLTDGKKKYAEYQSDIEDILEKSALITADLLALIEKDAEVFEPLSRAYGIPKDEPGRDEIMESALKNACTVPLDIMRAAERAANLAGELAVKGSRLAISDVGVAAAACRCAVEGAVMNVYINTKLMKDREYAQNLNAEAASLLASCVSRCEKIYNEVTDSLI